MKFGRKLELGQVREQTDHPGSEAIQGDTLELQQFSYIPEEWRGEACRLFDEEMAKRSGKAGYDEARRLASALRQYEEMSFEPSERERAILDGRKQEIEESARWIKENVLRDPLIKERMYEIVRDRGRDTGVPELDQARHKYLAEMAAKTTRPAKARPAGPEVSQPASA
ncbi:hypothetical protein [Burkholderia gladioli]|uniref:hypothetical protein n=1 Tax=Burkholderia gladioli TaxID=28095 RepID=UPI001C5D334B|nr:hypothetical protein [Burkholderia gladioli]MBW5284091.1 hypothetical protein [Burkholderia gladioli]